ncbi:MAG TPA: hypothetical protein VN973_02820 [Candidatus Dormibacteraeota bacterium]|nr:hypothetical protein [Candidatus Dormibacteraeota bacterium]
MYQWLVYAHIGSVLAFVLAHGASAAMALRIKGEPSADGIKALVALSTLSSQAMYPLLILVALTGIWLGAVGSWFGHAWIWTAIVALVLTVGLMNAMGRQYHAIRVAAGQGRGSDRAREPAPPAAPDEVRRLALATSPWPITILGVVALGFILWLMLFKPF